MDASVAEGSDVAGPILAVVVPTYRRHERLGRLVAALEAQTLDPRCWELVVVDDCSPGVSAEDLRTATASARITVRCVRTARNGGPAAARNLGWRSTAAPMLAFTDDDCVPDPGWLAAGLAALRHDPAIGVLQGRTLRLLGPDETYEYTPCTVIREVRAPSPWFEGCNLFLRRDALAAGDGFDEAIGWFGEETALAYRVLEAGWRRGWAPDALVLHDIEERPFRWHLRNLRLEGNLVALAARHPELRAAMWRPWSPTRDSGVFALAVGGLLAGSRWPPAAILAVPYLRKLARIVRTSGGNPVPAAYDVVFRGASLAGKVEASIRHRKVVL